MKKLVVLLFVLSLLLASSCSLREPDFIGYIYKYDKENKQTVLVAANSEENPIVLLRKGITRLRIGTKVEVFYEEDAVNSSFPLRAPANLYEIDVPAADKKAIERLFTFMHVKHERNFYPSILSIAEQESLWEVTVGEYSMNAEGSDRFDTMLYKLDKSDEGNIDSAPLDS
ncbi:hypothetical protein HGI30_14645 [Paenibacillus albicereus]|uniref:DUF3221 domain-containing protein n=1 Tax=Paenibacillus albicereus TaxID=2726185 RepID=A0A6H2GZZ5_9BACL|nr:hypothetical protein [Paenibacillus albicereus]QJC52678.1 hypothetical protein HGI30_14645 [Paenibacillus albicereus]